MASEILFFLGRSENNMTNAALKASRACAACQKYKRRCDKALPACALCSRYNISSQTASVKTSETASFEFLLGGTALTEHWLILTLSRNQAGKVV